MNPLVWAVLATTALSCFFALAGYSLRAYRRVQLEEAFNGTAGKLRLRALERHLTALRLTASFCRALTNLLLVIWMIHLFGPPAYQPGRTIAATALAAGIIAVFGVAIPHAWACYAGEKVLRATLGIMLVCRYALYPVIAIMQAFDAPIRRLSAFRDEDEQNADSAKQEILQAASEGQAEGAVDAKEVEMIESVIEFGDTQTAEIMTPRTDIFGVPVNMSWQEASESVVEAGHTRVPVYEGRIDNIIGILYAKDMIRSVDKTGVSSLRQIMRKPYFVPETKLLGDLLREFKVRKVHLAVVLDEYGGTAGIVTIEDVLEEIVGDISDEYDPASPALMRRVDESSAEVDGRLHINELNDAMGLKIPEDGDCDTVAGLVFSELGYIPTAGETLTAYGATFTVLAAEERRITRLHVEVLGREAEDGD